MGGGRALFLLAAAQQQPANRQVGNKPRDERKKGQFSGRKIRGGSITGLQREALITLVLFREAVSGKPRGRLNQSELIGRPGAAAKLQFGRGVLATRAAGNVAEISPARNGQPPGYVTDGSGTAAASFPATVTEKLRAGRNEELRSARGIKLQTQVRPARRGDYALGCSEAAELTFIY